MCGRYTLISIKRVADTFHVSNLPDLVPRYNIAPTQPILGIYQDNDTGRRKADLFYWGLIPSWAKDPSIGTRMINARGETIAEKPAFRSAFKRRRCLVPADGFYEWKKAGAKKKPYYFRVKGEGPFALAGLWEHWLDPGGNGSEIDSCTIVTTQANQMLREYHERMPVILSKRDCDLWLNPSADFGDVMSIVRPFPANEMEVRPVSARVNNARLEGAELLEAEKEIEKPEEKSRKAKGSRKKTTNEIEGGLFG